MNVYIVIPTIRSLTFLDEWSGLLDGCHLVIVEDHECQEIPTPTGVYASVSHVTWKDIRKDFGKNEWIFPRKNAGIRSYGFWKAYQKGADIIITLDDDCFPVDKDFIARHQSNLSLFGPKKWINTFPHPDFVYTRGFPYAIRKSYPAMISHGLWTKNIDLDAQTQLQHQTVDLPPYPPMIQFIPQGVYFPMCSMNLAFRREVTPLMYFPLMGYNERGTHWGFDRFDDIWAGLFAKKNCDHLNFAVVNGSPFVEHRKASDPHKNLLKEKTGITVNETLWQEVDTVRLTKQTPVACYKELAEKIKFPSGKYFTQLRRAMLVWADLF